jgi:ADP-heptose:LPS heptosyltransferase
VSRLPEITWIQGPGRKLEGVTQVSTESFRDACSLLDRASFFLGTDGGLHHAAAALGKKAVVIWGGYTHPRNLGYDSHINLHSGVEPCGNLAPCDHCKKAMDRITVDMVVNAVTKSLDSVQGKTAAVQECG